MNCCPIDFIQDRGLGGGVHFDPHNIRFIRRGLTTIPIRSRSVDDFPIVYSGIENKAIKVIRTGLYSYRRTRTISNIGASSVFQLRIMLTVKCLIVIIRAEIGRVDIPGFV